MFNGGCIGLNTNRGGGTSASGIAYDRPVLTGQTTSYRTGDDAWSLANGVYDYTPPVYPVSYAALDFNAVSPFTTLISNNAFGNKSRFTDDLGTQIYANNYIIDHYTGLGYADTLRGGSQSWDTNIDEAVALTFNSFSDWRVANFYEIYSIVDTSDKPLNYSPFNFSGSPTSVLQTSTTRHDNTLQYLRMVISSYVNSAAENKTTALSSRGYLAVRNHYT